MQDKMRTISEKETTAFQCTKVNLFPTHVRWSCSHPSSRMYDAQCNTMTGSIGVICLRDNHPVSKVKTMRRWFTCRTCKRHFSCLGQRFPDQAYVKRSWVEASTKGGHACLTRTRACVEPTCLFPRCACGSTSFERAAMLREDRRRTDPAAGLLVRGVEHGRFFHSHART